MDTVHALEEVSRELKLMAHYLKLVALREGHAGEDARIVAYQISALEKDVAARLQAEPVGAEMEIAN